MDLLEEFVDDNLLSKGNVLKYVDDYSIYSYYIGEELELYTKYSSPLRMGDDDPSFSIYYSKYRPDIIMFKDSASGKFGNVFDFLEEFLGFSTKKVLMQINSDFQLGLNHEEMGQFDPKILKPRPIRKSPMKIEVTRREQPSKEFLDYWASMGITPEVQDMYYARDVRVIHYISDTDHVTVPAKTLTISYEILGHYKIYQPFAERKYKFRNNYLDKFIEGALQLKFQKEFCVITKSTKECMFFRSHFDWDSVAGKSETTKIHAHFMGVLKSRYKYVFIWLDNDKAGQKAQAEYLELYPWLIPIYFTSNIEQSDPTDLYLAYPNQQAEVLDYLEKLIINKIT